MAQDALRAPRGTRDFYPEDMRQRQWLFERFREVSLRFGFEEVDAPLVEHAELFIRKAGEEIVDQLYHFELHGRHLALRPEFTPSLARMVMARAGALRMPLRWFSIPQCWRYERATRGRRREHYQWNLDVWGEPGVAAEAELIAAVFALCDAVGLAPGDVRMRVSSRALLEETLSGRLPAERRDAFEPLCVVIDKLDKIGREAVIEQLADPKGTVALERGLAEEVVDGLAVTDLDEVARRVSADSGALAELRRLFELLTAYGVADRVDFDASIVRGLAYYTGIVFEARDSAGELRALCGGGRYDRLSQSLGGPPLPAVGFGFGDAVLGELLSERKAWPELPRGIEDVVFAIGEDERPAAVRLASALRGEGRCVELVLGTPRLRRALADADRSGAERFFVIGPDEQARGVARLRELATREERDHPLPS